MLPQDIIGLKRDGEALTPEEIAGFVAGVTDGSVTEGQVAAFCMAVLLKGMDTEERAALTRAMAQSGTILDWDLPGPVIDKHSTGGIGDKVSLILAPIIAACGGFVPMISGRGLGHSGGTLDKMDSIPGYVSQPDIALFKKTVAEVGCAIVGATADIAPADKRMYAVRDTTATVESRDLITASILSKKLAAGLQGLVLDVKWGTGAFMRTYEEAEDLARTLVDAAGAAGLKTVALLTDMNQVLGRTAGNALEVAESVAVLKNEEPDARLVEVTLALAAEMLALSGIEPDAQAARKKARDALSSGAAAERFARMVATLGGPSDFMEKTREYLPPAPYVDDVRVPGGILKGLDGVAIGMGIVELGGGRRTPDDKIDHRVGLSNVARLGEDLATRPLATVHARNASEWRSMTEKLVAAMRIGSAPEDVPVRGRVAAG